MTLQLVPAPGPDEDDGKLTWVGALLCLASAVLSVFIVYALVVWLPW